MNFEPSPKARDYAERFGRFIKSEIEPVERAHWEGILAAQHGGQRAWAKKALRLADGPDEVHKGVIARIELAKRGYASSR